MRLSFFPKPVSASPAYDLWAEEYDNQPQNLMLQLDQQVFSTLLSKTDLVNKTILDIGCGTGRHWKKILERTPKSLIGYDVSKGMLTSLQKKFPQAVARLSQDNKLADIESLTIDLIISTLTIAHIKDLSALFSSWNRVLKKGGEIIVTDFHPVLLAKGGERNFDFKGEKIRILNYTHLLELISELAMFHGWNLLHFIERNIDEELKPFYIQQRAEHIYDRYKGTPVIFGLQFSKL